MGKSTGPRTSSGKARSSKNAAKHWIESGRILAEEESAAAILRKAFGEDFKPQGSIEHEVIDDLTMNRLMKRRIDIAFTREFSKARIEKTLKSVESHERSASQFWLRYGSACGSPRNEDHKAERLRPDLCVTALEGLKRGISSHGTGSGDLATLREVYGNEVTEHAAMAIHLMTVSVQDKSNKAADQEILRVLQAEIEVQKKREQLVKQAQDIESQCQPQEPPGAALDTLLRYRAANTREFKLLLDSLEHVRHLRNSAA